MKKHDNDFFFPQQSNLEHHRKTSCPGYNRQCGTMWRIAHAILDIPSIVYSLMCSSQLSPQTIIGWKVRVKLNVGLITTTTNVPATFGLKVRCTSGIILRSRGAVLHLPLTSSSTHFIYHEISKLFSWVQYLNGKLSPQKIAKNVLQKLVFSFIIRKVKYLLLW